jgi:hypothetical protein
MVSYYLNSLFEFNFISFQKKKEKERKRVERITDNFIII